MGQFDWKLESEDSLQARIQAANEAQSRTRVAVVLLTIASMMIVVALFNAYKSYDYDWILEQTDKGRMIKGDRTPDEVLLEQALRGWADARNVNIAPLGIKVSVDDAPVIGSLSVLLLSLWLMMCARRENHTIGFLLRDTDSDESEFKVKELTSRHVRWWVFHSIAANTVFIDFSRSFARIDSLQGANPTGNPGQLQKRCFAVLGSGFYWFPVVTLAMSGVVDFFSYKLRDPFLLGAPPPPSGPDSWRIGFFVFFFVQVLIACCFARRYAYATERILRTYYRKIRKDLRDGEGRAG